MERLLIQNVNMILPDARRHHGWLLVEEGKIARIGDHDSPTDVLTIDGKGLNLLPGFIDLHVHGAMGYEAMDASAEGLRCMAQYYARHGVTGFLATTWTDSRESIYAALKNIADVQGAQPEGATILGAHLEGPYLNAEKSGAQSAKFIRRAARDEALAFLDLNVIKLLALAPEYAENLWLIEECARRGITVSAAHTNALYNQMQRAIELGLRQATHTYNAMRGMNHHEPGALGAVLTNPLVKCELIADNIHVHPAMMRLLFMLKGHEGVILITDSVRAAGMPEGDYRMDERTIMVKDGAVRLSDGTLAGSILTLNRALHNYIQATEQPLEYVWQASSLNAAHAIGIDSRKGSLEVGKDADLVLVNRDIEVYMTIADGRIVYRKDAF